MTEEAGITVGLLGPLEVGIGGQTVVVGRPKQRALLAVLALSPGVCVSRDRLVDELWGAAPPDSAAHALQVHVSGLRKLLGPDVVATCTGGYKLAVRPSAVDAVRAAELVAAGRRDRDADALADALALFRGRPLEDVGLEGPCRHEAERLADLKTEALEERYELELDAGGGPALVAPLERLVAEHPLRERPRALLMRALYRAGRQGEALAVLQDARRTFVEELGLEPSPALRELERAILQQELPAAAPAALAENVPASRRRRKALLAVALAALATGAGVLAAILLPTSNPSAAPPRQTPPSRTPATVVAAPVSRTTSRRHAARKTARVTHHRVVHRPVAQRHVAHRSAATTTQAPASSPTTTHPVSVTVPVPTTTALKVPTHPVATTPTPTTTAAPLPTGPVRVVDTFDKPTVDESTWNIWIQGSGPTIVRQGGKLIASIPQGATPRPGDGILGAQYVTKACFAGDIDTQVDYELLKWTPRSSAFVSIGLDNVRTMAERLSSPDGSDIVASWIDPHFVSMPASGTRGSLRITRVGGVVTTYTLVEGAWVKIDSETADGPAQIVIGLSFNQNVVPSADATVALDNFSAEGTRPNAC